MIPENSQLYPENLVPALVAIPWAGHKSNREPESRGPDNFPIYAEDSLRPCHLLLDDYMTAAREHYEKVGIGAGYIDRLLR